MKSIKFGVAAGLITAILSTGALAQSYTCNIKPTARGKQNATVNSSFSFRFSGDSVRVSDKFIRATGKRSVNGTFDRKVGGDLLFSWTVNGVPRNLMPKEVSWYRPTVTYRARLDTSTRRVRVTANFVQRYGGGNTGSNIKGFGNCR
jgi:hypothetical protein